MANNRQLIDKDEILSKSVVVPGCISRMVSTWDIANAPTVDAVEVVHGRWVNPYINRYGHPCHCCSICGFKASYQDKNYCHNCGAKMDGDGNG